MIDLRFGDFYNCFNDLKQVSIDLILTDPPYNISGFDRLKETMWDRELDLTKLEEIFASLLKPRGQVILFCDIHLFVRIYNAFQKHLEFRFRHIWEKGCGMPINLYRPISETEMIAVFKHKKDKVSELTFNPQSMGENGIPYIKRNRIKDIPTRKSRKADYSQNLNGTRFPRTILKAPSKPNMNKPERTNHPTQKPIHLLKKLILGYSNEGDMILDPFSGSGSTHLAAYETGRNAIGYEIKKSYHLEAIKRIERHTAQITLF